jgi:cell wall-associated NlpC family hydrolase
VVAFVVLAGSASPAVAAGGAGVGDSSTTPTSTTPSSPSATTNGGQGIGAPLTAPSTPVHPTVPGDTAKIIKGIAYAPAYAPRQVQEIIWAGNQIRTKPYVYGGGHGVWKDIGYDCSGSVSYVLHAADLLKTSMDSSGLESWGQSGTGQWVTVYTNPGHAFIQVAGIRFDTSAEGDPHPAPGTGPRWRPLMHGAPGFQSRHPSNL